jgi:hypothetical protein
MDVFGHRDEQMTIMRYILSDPGILSEVQQVVREMLILKEWRRSIRLMRFRGRRREATGACGAVRAPAG